MRPEQKAPDNPPAPGIAAGELIASMRPEQKAPDNIRILEDGPGRGAASMRPEQKAPDNCRHPATDDAPAPRFNEAGAKSPG